MLRGDKHLGGCQICIVLSAAGVLLEKHRILGNVRYVQCFIAAVCYEVDTGQHFRDVRYVIVLHCSSVLQDEGHFVDVRYVIVIYWSSELTSEHSGA